MRVKEDAGGIIRIWIGEVPSEILQTNISLLSLSPIAQYNPDAVFDAILGTKEMAAAENELGYRPPITLGASRTMPDQRLPHLPTALSNVTAEKVLDEIAKTWAGRVVVLYGACADQTTSDHGRLFTLRWEGQR